MSINMLKKMFPTALLDFQYHFECHIVNMIVVQERPDACVDTTIFFCHI